MEETLIKATLVILDFQQIRSCIVGELALNYYNVPRVLHVRSPDSPQYRSWKETQTG